MSAVETSPSSSFNLRPFKVKVKVACVLYLRAFLMDIIHHSELHCHRERYQLPLTECVMYRNYRHCSLMKIPLDGITDLFSAFGMDVRRPVWI